VGSRRATAEPPRVHRPGTAAGGVARVLCQAGAAACAAETAEQLTSSCTGLPISGWEAKGLVYPGRAIGLQTLQP